MKFGIHFIFVVALICGGSAVFALSPQQQFEDANRAFAAGNDAQAIQIYQILAQQYGISSALLFNLANAQYRAKQLGDAILNYERARLLNPRDPDIIANLKIARDQNGLAEPDSPWWLRIGDVFAWNMWAWINLGILVALCLTAALALWRPALYPPLKIVNMILLFAFVITLWGLAAQWRERDRAIITAPEPVVRISPFETVEISFPTATGELVYRLQSHGDFVLIRNQKSKTGWLPKTQLQSIIPDFDSMF